MTQIADTGNSVPQGVLGLLAQGGGILVLDGAGRIRFANARFWALAGRAAPGGLSPDLADLVSEVDRAPVERAISAATEGTEAIVDVRVEREDGAPAWLHLSLTPLEGPDAAESLVVAVVTTDSAGDTRLRALLEGTPAMVVVADAEGRATFTNRAWEEFTGLAAADGPHWAERGYIHPEDVARAMKAWKKALASGQGYDIDYRVRTAEGQYCWVAFQIRPVRDESGAVVSWTSAAIDIDERVRTQVAFASSEARLRALVDATPAMVVTTDAEGAVQLVSHEWSAFTGLDAEAMATWRELDTLHPEDAAATADERRKGLLSKQGYDVDYRLRRFDGEYRWVNASVRPALAADGRLLGWMFVAVDIDDRVRASKKLEAVNADLRQLAESIPAIVVTSPEDPAQAPFANRLWTEYTGIPLEQVTQETIARLVHREDAAGVLEISERARAAREPYEVEFRLRRHDGAYRWFAWRSQPLIEAGGENLGWIAAGVEIDEQVRLREELEQTNEHLQLLADAGHAIANAVDYEAAMEAAAGVLVPSFAAWCAVDIVTDAGTITRKVSLHSPGINDEAAAALATSPPSLADSGDHLTGVIQSGQGFFIPQMRRGDGTLGPIEEIAPISFIAVPLRAVGGRTLGVLSLARVGDELYFDDQDFATISELGRRLAAALDRSHLFSQVTRALANLRLLADAGLALSGSGELDEALEKATGIIVPAYADWCSVDLVDGHFIRRARLAHSDRVSPEAADAVRQVLVNPADLADPVARIIDSGEPLFLPQMPADMAHLGSRSPAYRAAASRLGARSTIGVPLESGERRFGVLGIARVAGREPFDEADLALARELGRQLGGWVERARLFSELRQALSAKDEFFGFVSHELKTPLTTVVGVSDVLARRYAELDESQRQDAVSLIRRDSLRLEEIIANMLTLARSERQSGDEPMLVQHVIASAVSMHRQRHPQREVTVDLEPGLPPILAPGGWVDRVVENLLSNAEKYSEPDTPIEIRATLGGSEVSVEVRDRGRGISEEQMRDVFEPFFRADPNEPGVSGVGLGLTVCRRLIERLGGEVWLARREGGGTIAGFRLPVMAIPEE